ncbi:MAG: hypothetical protein ACLFR0_07410 [Alphaproteobacteria bacterium]
MNIDLLLTRQGEAGLITSENFSKKVAGIVFDPPSGTLTLEFVDMDYMDLNIGVDSVYNASLDMNQSLHIGSVKDGQIGQAYQVPLMFSDDPYRNEIMNVEPASSPLMAFQYFINACIAGQPVHREDLGDDDTMGCVLGDSSPSSLEFAPHLARRHALETKPNVAPSINAPGMGLGGGSSGGGYSGGRSSHTGGQSSGSAQGSKDGKKK